MHIHLNKHTISNSRSVSIQETGDGEGTKNHPFFLLVEYFYSRVGRKLSWKRQCAKKHVSDIVSVSDEVFSLLVLENCWDVWLHKARKVMKMILLHQNTFIPVLEDRERDMGAGTQRDMPGSTACMT